VPPVFAIVNPTTEEVVREVEGHDEQEVEGRLSRAVGGFEANKRRSLDERARLFDRLAEVLLGRRDDLAREMTLQMGKPISQARAEVEKSARCCKFYAKRLGEFLAPLERDPVPVGACQAWVVFEPLGAVLGIMPWNFPLWQVIRFAVPALAAGNSALLKHASNVAAFALEIERCFEDAGFSSGEFQCLLIGAEEVAPLIAREEVAAVTLTGSDAAGSEVARAAGQSLKPCVMELGGSDPFIVCESADLESAVRTAVAARCQNNGQSCIAAKRFFVHESLYQSFVEGMCEKMASLRVGDPLEEATDLGPLATRAGRDQAQGYLEDALSKGARLRWGRGALEGPGFFFEPVVVEGVTPGCRMWEEEVFAPIAQVRPVSSTEEAVALANDSRYGLGAACFTRDEDEARFVAARLEVGMVFVNAMVASYPELPFGGVKRSGFGRELAEFGARSFCNVKTLYVAGG
jgi:succinate-semialdehyde dehydrogenase/glutarate-semialdehyde dehydrogenase